MKNIKKINLKMARPHSKLPTCLQEVLELKVKIYKSFRVLRPADDYEDEVLLIKGGKIRASRTKFA